MKLRVTNKNSEDIGRRVEVMDRIRELLDGGKKALVVSHVDPDGDALGTQLAVGAYLRSRGKDVYMVRDSEIPEKYRFLPGVQSVTLASQLPEDFTVDTVVILECPNISRIGSASRLLTDAETIINIDHHPDGVDLGHVNWVDSTASSVGELIYEFFEHVGYEIGPDVATQLYTAILTDTGRFRFASTTPRSMQIAALLIEAGANPRTICDSVYYNVRPSTMKLVGKVLNTIEFHENDTICILTLTNDMLKDTGADVSESDGLVDYTLYNSGVRAGALLKEIDRETTKVSLRSCDGINVAAIAAKFGGGGHYQAAGCMIPKPLELARKELLAHLTEASRETE
jgi:phosphoesterase RecJ-like protein